MTKKIVIGAPGSLTSQVAEVLAKHGVSPDEIDVVDEIDRAPEPEPVASAEVLEKMLSVFDVPLGRKRLRRKFYANSHPTSPRQTLRGRR